MKGGRRKLSMPRSAMGTIMEPVDVDSEEKIDDLDARIQIGKLSLVFVYAPWCGHCQHYKPIMDELEKMPNRSVQIARVRDDVYPKTALGPFKSMQFIDCQLLLIHFYENYSPISNPQLKRITTCTLSL